MAYSQANTGANIATGAGSGAAVGTAIMPGWGTAIGAGVGALVGVFQSIAQYHNDAERRRAVERLATQIGADYKELQKQFDTWYDTKGSEFFGEDAKTDYQDAAAKIRDFDFSKYDWLDTDGDGVVSDKEKEAAKYTYNRDIDYFMNPYLEDLQSDAAAKVEHTAAGAGLGRGTGAARAVANSVSEIKDKAYNTALNEWKADRNFDYQQWADYNQAMRDRLANMLSVDQWQIGQQKAIGEDWINWENNAFENKMKLKQDALDAQTQISLAGL